VIGRLPRNNVDQVQEKNLSELGLKTRRVGGITIIEIVGALRIELRFGRSTVTLANAISDLIANGQKKILLNLGGIKIMSAKELGDLVSIYLEARKSGGEFKLFSLKPSTHELMRITKLSSVLDVYETEETAIASFANQQRSSSAEWI
jgi:anti-sigma B factor antagonist